MGLFKRRLPTPTPTSTSTSTGETPGLRELAASRSWQPVEGDPFDSGVTSNIWRLNFALYGQREPIGIGGADTAAPRRSTYHETYEGTVEGRRLVVTNHSTNIAQLRIYNFEAVAGTKSPRVPCEMEPNSGICNPPCDGSPS